MKWIVLIKPWGKYLAVLMPTLALLLAGCATRHDSQMEMTREYSKASMLLWQDSLLVARNLAGEYTETEVIYRHDSSGKAIPTVRRDRNRRLQVADSAQATRSQVGKRQENARQDMRGKIHTEASTKPFDPTPIFLVTGAGLFLIVSLALRRVLKK